MTASSAQTSADGPRWIGLAERTVVDVAEGKTTYLLSGRNGSQMRLSASALKLLELRQSGVESDEIAEAMNRNGGQAISGEELEAKYQKLLGRIEDIEDHATDNPLGFWFRIRLLPESVVVKIAAVLSPLFQPKVAKTLLATLVVAFLLLGGGPLSQDTGPSTFWAGYCLLMLSIVFHEFGHATACAYYGARPSDIGFTFYLIYPALYSDVSSAWKLRRSQRVVVDLGGLYFQWLVAGIYLAIYTYTGWKPLATALLMIIGSSVFSLNPIFKFDGYWMMADALGVTNLSRQPTRIFKYYLQRLRGQDPEPLPWSSRLTAFLTFYSVVSISVWGFFLWIIGPRVWHSVRILPSQLELYLAGSPEVGFASLLMSVFMAALMIFIGWRMASSVIIHPAMSVARMAKEKWDFWRGQSSTVERQDTA